MKALPDVEIVAMFRMSSLPFRGTLSSLHFSIKMFVTCEMPLLNATGLEPDETAFMPWFTSSWVINVVVVVPSPALLSDLPATSWMSFAPMFIAGSGRSMSRAIVTPSFTISGAP
jgi:hypothetical protein